MTTIIYINTYSAFTVVDFKLKIFFFVKENEVWIVQPYSIIRFNVTTDTITGVTYLIIDALFFRSTLDDTKFTLVNFRTLFTFIQVSKTFFFLLRLTSILLDYFRHTELGPNNTNDNSILLSQ